MRESLRRAFASFLAIPTTVIAGFVLLAIAAFWLERHDSGLLQPVRDYMESHVFGDPSATSSLLGTVATGVITITSITFSLLLLALQQSASSLTHQVFEQFLQRRLNQVYFGIFIGIALFALITLASVDPPFNPVIGATLALAFTIVALYVLLLLIYSTVSQMRPAEIIKTIHDHTLRARENQLALIHRTRRVPAQVTPDPIPVRASCDGYVAGIDLDALERVLRRADGPAEIVLHVPIGAYVSYQDTLAEMHGGTVGDPDRTARDVERAIALARHRDPMRDPACGVEQLEIIAWRSISTSQQNPSPGGAVIRNLRDLLARWAVDPETDRDMPVLAVVYPDNVPTAVLGALESLAVVASEAMQHQTLAEIATSIEVVFDRLPSSTQAGIVEMLTRILPAMGDHVLTGQLERALRELIATLERTGHGEVARMYRQAVERMAADIGSVRSRGTRGSG